MKKQLSREVIIREILKGIAIGFAAGVFCSLVGRNDTPVMSSAVFGTIGGICGALIELTFFPQWVRK